MTEDSKTKYVVVTTLAVIVFACVAAVLLTLTAVVVRALWQIV